MTATTLLNDKQTEDIRECMNLLKELDDAEKLQVKGIMIGMQLSRSQEVVERR